MKLLPSSQQHPTRTAAPPAATARTVVRATHSTNSNNIPPTGTSLAHPWQKVKTVFVFILVASKSEAFHHDHSTCSPAVSLSRMLLLSGAPSSPFFPCCSLLSAQPRPHRQQTSSRLTAASSPTSLFLFFLSAVLCGDNDHAQCCLGGGRVLAAKIQCMM
jgi:hypothetical protein